MDVLYYVLFVYSCVVISVLLLGVLILRMLKNKKLVLVDYILVLITSLGFYQIVPYSIYRQGSSISYNENKKAINLYKKANNLSINPYEKDLCNYDIAFRYYMSKNGNESIKYFEKLGTKYWTDSYNINSSILIRLYILKGDYTRAQELLNLTNRHIYYKAELLILNKQYDKALNLLLKEENKEWKYSELMLISAIYKEKGNIQKSQEYYNKATEKFNNKQYNNKAKQQEDKEKLLQLSTIDKFKKNIEKEKIKYGF